MDMHEFEEAFRRIMDSSDKMGVYDVMERMNAEHPDIVNRLHAAVRENAELLEIYDWLVDNAHLSYVDEYSQLYIHAGLLAAGALDMGLFGRLDEEEYALMGLFRMLRGNGDPARARDVEAQAGRISGHLEVRPTDWQKDFLNSGGFPVLMEVLTDLGIRGIIYGHTPVGDVKPHTARVWNLDLGMGAHYGGRGGAVVFGPTGVHSYIFRDFSSPEITKEEVVKGEEFMFDLEDDSALIARAFREYFMHAAAAVTPAAAVASDEEEE
jgi:hypothetical protein